MEVYAQTLTVDLDKNGSMFDFMVRFSIPHFGVRDVNAQYVFDKNSTPKQEKESLNINKMSRKDEAKRRHIFNGAANPTTNDAKPFKFNTLAGTKGPVDAQVKLESSTNSSFTIAVLVAKKKDHFVNMTFDGAKPSWLGGDKAIFNGKLSMVVKDLRPKKPWER